MGKSATLAAPRALSNQPARWLILIAGVINPILFVLVYMTAGFLRPGYSPIHQWISDLGVGPNGAVLDGIDVVHGLLLVAFALGFAFIMRSTIGSGWLLAGAVFLVLRGLGGITAGIFTEAPATVAIHSLAAFVSVISMITAFIIIGVGLIRAASWQGWGIYSVAARVITLILAAVMFWTFAPGTTVAPLRLGGLMERVVSVETLAWYVVFGWRLFFYEG